MVVPMVKGVVSIKRAALLLVAPESLAPSVSVSGWLTMFVDI